MNTPILKSGLVITWVAIDAITPYENNPRKIPKEAIEKVAASIREFGFRQPIVVDKDMVVVVGHTRLLAARSLGYDEVPVLVASDLPPEKVKAYRLADNRTNEFTSWDDDRLMEELTAFLSVDGFDMEDFGFDMSFLGKSADDVEEDDFEPETEYEKARENCNVERGERWMLGNHVLMCGDSTSSDDMRKLMGKETADLIFTDPPYGMGKQIDGVANDNLYGDNLLSFNRKWIELSMSYLKGVGSFYCWGIDEPLMDIYSEILKPMIRNNEITFRNLITWDKDSAQGRLSSGLRKYPVADEKCLFVMKGVQGFNDNKDNYFEDWEPIRKYLSDSMKEMGWTGNDVERILGCSTGRHYFTKSQWEFPTRENYQKLQRAARKQAESKDYEAFKKDYEEIKKDYEEIKKDYYTTRAYFDNTHDNMTDVWHFPPLNNGSKEREETGGHATPKPIALCSRAIKSSSRESEKVLDLFGGSGSTLIACEKLGRQCYMMELEPMWCQVIINRWEALTGKTAEKVC